MEEKKKRRVKSEEEKYTDFLISILLEEDILPTDYDEEEYIDYDPS